MYGSVGRGCGKLDVVNRARLSTGVWKCTVITAMVGAMALSACSDKNRTATNFCRQLAKELPGMSAPLTTQNDIDVLVSRYRRIGETAPRAVADDWSKLTAMLENAARLNTANSTAVEDFASNALAANTAAQRALQWVKDTCGVDLSGSRPASQ